MPKSRLTVISHAIRQLEAGKKLLLAGMTIAAIGVPLGAQSQPQA